MSIYEKEAVKKARLQLPELPKKHLLFLLIAFLVLAFVFSFSVFVSKLFQPRVLLSALSPNPLDLSQEQNSMLTVRVFNPTEQKSENAVLRIEPVSLESLIVFPTAKSIQGFGSKETRELLFTIRPSPNKRIDSGNYTIKIILTLGEQKFEDEIVLVIKAV